MNMNNDGARQKAWFFLGVMLCTAMIVGAMPRFSIAQDEAAAPAAEAKEADAPAPAVSGQAQPKEQEVENFLAWVIRCSGIIGLVILILSIVFVSIVGRLFWELRLDMAAPPELMMQCETLLEQRDFKGIFGLVREDDSFFGRLMTTGITELPNGLAEARESMERVGEALTAEMEKKISMLAVMGTLGPMIGLLGTLKGMIASFSVIARSDVQMKASEVANGISEALLLTFEGVALSVPAIFFFALFRNRVIHIASSVMLTADQFLRHFSHAGRAKASAAAPTVKN